MNPREILRAFAAQEGVAVSTAYLGLTLVLWWVWRVRHRLDPLGPRPSGPLPRTDGALAFGFVGWLIAGAILVPLAQAARFTPPATILAGSLTHAAIAFAVLPYVQSADFQPVLAPRRLVGAGLAMALVTFMAVAAVQWGVEALYSIRGDVLPEQDAVRYVRGARGLETTGVLVAAGVLAPFSEEIVYRGALLPFLARRLGRRDGLLLQAAIFGMMHVIGRPPAEWAHLILPHALPLAVVGWMAGWTYLRTASLPAAFVVHAVFNGVNLALILI